jgi:2-polyprenyl-3-methyl-5-hydroxy-6-metoxy-1,4-benzoquinol methylase
MSDQQKWNERYLSDDMPWDIGISHPEMERLFSQYISKGKSVLDIGCGTGINASWLDHAGYQVTAIDISEEAIKLAKQNNSSIQLLSLFLKS